MKISYKVSDSSFMLEGAGFCENSNLESIIGDISQVLEAYLEAEVDLEQSDLPGDGPNRAIYAMLLKIEILLKDLSAQSELLSKLRTGILSPTDVGFPEFEYLDY